MTEVPDAPTWLTKLLAASNVTAYYEEVWKPQLAKRGVTPDMLRPVGDSPGRPSHITIDDPGLSWCSVEIRWELGGDTVMLDAIRRLIIELDKRQPGSERGSDSSAQP